MYLFKDFIIFRIFHGKNHIEKRCKFFIVIISQQFESEAFKIAHEVFQIFKDIRYPFRKARLLLDESEKPVQHEYILSQFHGLANPCYVTIKDILSLYLGFEKLCKLDDTLFRQVLQYAMAVLYLPPEMMRCLLSRDFFQFLKVNPFGLHRELVRKRFQQQLERFVLDAFADFSDIGVEYAYLGPEQDED